MSTVYTHSHDTTPVVAKTAISFLITILIFALLPILHLLPDLWIFGPKTYVADNAINHPLVVVEAIPVKPMEKPKLDKPKIDKPKPRPTLKQIENLFIVGGGIGDDSIFSNYTDLIDPDADLKIFNPDQLQRKPRPIFQAQPTYPYELKNQKIEGWVLLEWIITDKGRAIRPRVISFSHRGFQQATIDSILKSKRSPGEISNKPVYSRVRQNFTFNL